MCIKITRIGNKKEKKKDVQNLISKLKYRKISYSINLYSSVEDKFKKLTKNTNLKCDRYRL